MRTRRASTTGSRVITVIVVVWLLIGLAAAVQRDYFAGSDATCAKVGTTLVTIVSRPAELHRGQPEDRLHRTATIEVTAHGGCGSLRHPQPPRAPAAVCVHAVVHAHPPPPPVRTPPSCSAAVCTAVVCCAGGGRLFEVGCTSVVARLQGFLSWGGDGVDGRTAGRDRGGARGVPGAGGELGADRRRPDRRPGERGCRRCRSRGSGHLDDAVPGMLDQQAGRGAGDASTGRSRAARPRRGREPAPHLLADPADR